MDRFLTIDRHLADETEKVLDEVGIDLETVVKMTLKRIVREGGIAFLISKFDEPASKFTNQPMVRMADGKIGKSQAIALFSAQGIRFNRNVTFASKNKTAFNYWANPFFAALEEDWYLILNDWINRELHLFFIPAKSIHPSKLVARIDQQEKIDLQICFNDPTYTDNRSKISFSRYLVKNISY
jgi:antitoxin component of RelBE/YafQ-DinJ toxin-antitoxin module